MAEKPAVHEVHAHVRDIFVVFDCPRGIGTCPGNKCQVAVKGDTPWKNVGTDVKPTLTPSYNCTGGCKWHGYIVDGKAIDTPVLDVEANNISTIHICDACGHPELLTVMVKSAGPFKLGIGKTVVRATKEG